MSLNRGVFVKAAVLQLPASFVSSRHGPILSDIVCVQYANVRAANQDPIV